MFIITQKIDKESADAKKSGGKSEVHDDPSLSVDPSSKVNLKL